MQQLQLGVTYLLKSDMHYALTEFHETHQIRTLCPDPDTLKFGVNAPRIDGCRLCNTSVFLLFVFKGTVFLHTQHVGGILQDVREILRLMRTIR